MQLFYDEVTERLGLKDFSRWKVGGVLRDARQTGNLGMPPPRIYICCLICGKSPWHLLATWMNLAEPEFFPGNRGARINGLQGGFCSKYRKYLKENQRGIPYKPNDLEFPSKSALPQESPYCF